MAGANGNLGTRAVDRASERGCDDAVPRVQRPGDSDVPRAREPADLQDEECICTTSTAAPAWRMPPARWLRRCGRSRRCSSPATVIAGQNVNLSGAGSARRVQPRDQHVFLGSRERRGRAYGTEQHADDFGERTRDGLVHGAAHRDRRRRPAGLGGYRDQPHEHVDFGAGHCRQQRVPGGRATAAGDHRCRNAGVRKPRSRHRHPDVCATVSNAQSNTSVTWQVNGVTGGNATIGTISVGGTYTAPATCLRLRR